MLLIFTPILSACGSATPLQTFTGSGVTLKYPSSWQRVDMSANPVCSGSGFECVIQVGESDGTDVKIIRSDATGLTVDYLDEQGWAPLAAMTDAHLTSRDTIQINGQAAVQRVYDLSSPKATSGRAYIMQIYVIANGQFYSFTYFAPNSDAFNKHQQTFRDIISSVQFKP